MKKLIILSLLVSLGIATTKAQEKSHYFDLHLGGGYHLLQYDLDNGSQDGGLGLNFNLGYSYFFNSRWGISTGIGLQSFKSDGTLNYMSTQPNTDSEGTSYEHRTYYNYWNEEQNTLFLDIPLGISHMVKLNDSWKLRGTFGAKVSLAMSSKYEHAGGNLETRGYFPEQKGEVFGIEEEGFYTVTSIPDGDYEFDPVFATYADFGAMYKLKENLDLYMGLYASYGLNSTIEDQTKEPYQIDGTYNGILASNQSGEVIPLSVGVKVGLTWKHKKSSPAIIEDPLPVIEEKKTEPVLEQEPAPSVETTPVVKPEPVVEEAPKEAPEVVEAPKVEQKIEEMPVIRFKFGTDSIEGDPEEKMIKKVAERLLANKEAKLLLVGHTDNKGSRSVNMRVGLKRANTIKQKLVDLGVNGSQITTESKAFDNPLVPNTSDENMAQNRRVEFIWVE